MDSKLIWLEESLQAVKDGFYIMCHSFTALTNM